MGFINLSEFHLITMKFHKLHHVNAYTEKICKIPLPELLVSFVMGHHVNCNCSSHFKDLTNGHGDKCACRNSNVDVNYSTGAATSGIQGVHLNPSILVKG